MKNTQHNKPLRYGVIAFVLAVFLTTLFTACSLANSSSGTSSAQNNPSAPPSTANAGFSSSEEAAKAYLEGLRDGDLSRMISTFGIETYAKQYDYNAFTKRIGAYIPAAEIHFPNSNEFLTAMNTESRRSRVTTAIIYQYIALASPNFDSTAPQQFKEEAQIDKFLAEYEANLTSLKLETLSIVEFISPETLSAQYLSEANQQNLAENAAVLGADKIESNVAVFTLDGKKYLLCYDAAQYGDQWFLSQLGGNIGALMSISSQYSGLVPEEFLK